MAKRRNKPLKARRYIANAAVLALFAVALMVGLIIAYPLWIK